MLPKLQQKFNELKYERNIFWQIIAAATPEQQLYKPESKSWCMREVAQHVLASETGVLKFISLKPSLPSTFLGNIKNTLNTTLLLVFLKSPIKFKLPEKKGLAAAILPLEIMPYNELLDKWLAVIVDWEQYLNTVKPEQLSNIVFKHPVSGKMNLYQTLNFLIAHVKHHIFQLNRIKNNKAFLNK